MSWLWSVTLTCAKDQLHGQAQGCSHVVLALLNSGLCSGGWAGSPEDPSHGTALHHTDLFYLSQLPAPSSLPSPSSLGVQGHLLRAEGRTSSAEKGMEGRLIFLAVSTDAVFIPYLLVDSDFNATVSWEVRLEEQRYQWLHHGRSHRLQRLVVPAGNCFCDKIEFGCAAHNVLSAAHTLTNLFAWGCGDASVRMCSGLAELSAPRVSVDEEGLVTEENQQNSLQRKIRRWWCLSTFFCGVMGESQKYIQSISEALVLTELCTSTISLSLLLSFEIRAKELDSFVPCVKMLFSFLTYQFQQTILLTCEREAVGF